MEGGNYQILLPGNNSGLDWTRLLAGRLDPSRAFEDDEDVPPEVPLPEKVLPVTSEDLSEYVEGLRQLTKRKRDLRPAIDAVESKLRDVVDGIDRAEKFPADLKAALDAFPTELLTADIVQAKEKLSSLMGRELEKWSVSARHTRDDMEEERARLTTYLVDMNRAGASAGHDPVQKNMCPVCLTSEITVACDPCGHTFCDKCCQECSSFRMTCPMCRAPVKKRMRVYFSV